MSDEPKAAKNFRGVLQVGRCTNPQCGAVHLWGLDDKGKAEISLAMEPDLARRVALDILLQLGEPPQRH